MTRKTKTKLFRLAVEVATVAMVVSTLGAALPRLAR
jgi:hypothetical protein